MVSPPSLRLQVSNGHAGHPVEGRERALHFDVDIALDADGDAAGILVNLNLLQDQDHLSLVFSLIQKPTSIRTGMIAASTKS